MILKNNFFILTGGPGAGKTSVIQELARRGYHIIEEVGRNIIKNELTTGGNALPWQDRQKYADKMLAHSIEDFVSVKQSDEIYFFDRGIPDTYRYINLEKLELNQLIQDAVQLYRYNQKAFIFPAWRATYENDAERKQDFQKAVSTYENMYSVYEKLEYEIIEVPFGSITQRTDFVLNKVDC